MNIKQLKNFRAKLKYAKKLCASYQYNKYIVFVFSYAGLISQCADTESHRIMPNNVFEWYIDPARTPADRKAMWDNSIAAVDERIAKAK